MTFIFNSTDESLSELIDPEQLDINSLERIISSQQMLFEVDEDDIHIKEGLPFDVFVSIVNDKKIIKLRTYLEVKKNLSEKDVRDIVKMLNSETAPLKFTTNTYSKKNSTRIFIEADYYFFYEFGVTSEYVLYLIRFFSLTFSNAIRLANADSKIVDGFSVR